MEHLTLTNILLALCGLILHALIKFQGRRNKHKKFSLKFWFKDNLLTTVISLTATFSILLMLGDITKFFGVVSVDGGIAFESIVAFLAGYSNQSLIRNLISIVKSKKTDE